MKYILVGTGAVTVIAAAILALVATMARPSNNTIQRCCYIAHKYQSECRPEEWD